MNLREEGRGFIRYIRGFEREIMGSKPKKELLLELLNTCKRVVTKREVAERLAKKKNKDIDNIYAMISQRKGNNPSPADILEKYLIVVPLPRPVKAPKGKEPPEFFVLTDIGEWVKACRIGEDFDLSFPSDEDLFEMIELVSEKLGKYDGRQTVIYLASRKYTNVEDPEIEIKIETPRDPDWGRPGCEIYGRVEENGLEIEDEKRLKRQLKAILFSWVEDILSLYYDEQDLNKVRERIEFKFESKENSFEFSVKVEPVGIIGGKDVVG